MSFQLDPEPLRPRIPFDLDAAVAGAQEGSSKVWRDQTEASHRMLIALHLLAEQFDPQPKDGGRVTKADVILSSTSMAIPYASEHPGVQVKIAGLYLPLLKGNAHHKAAWGGLLTRTWKRLRRKPARPWRIHP